MSGSTPWAVPQGFRTASEWAWRGIVLAIAIGAAIYGLAAVSQVTIPVTVALLLAALLAPVHHLLARHLPPAAAAGVVVFGVLAVVIGLFSVVGSQLAGQFDDIVAQTTQGVEQVRSWIQSTFKITDTQVSDYIAKAQKALSSSNLTERATAAGATAGHVLAGTLIALFTLFFFLKDGPRIWAWVVRLFPRATRAKVHSSGEIAWGQLKAFTHATIVVAAVDAIGIGVGAAVLGVPFASGIALLVFFGAFIPIVGALMSGAVAVLLALVALGPVKALIMLGVVLAVQQLESHILQPLLIGRAMSLHPLSVVLAIATGVLVAGVTGGLVAVPVVAVVNAVGHHLLDGEPEPQEASDVLTPAQEAQAAAEVERAGLVAEDSRAADPEVES